MYMCTSGITMYTYPNAQGKKAFVYVHVYTFD